MSRTDETRVLLVVCLSCHTTSMAGDGESAAAAAADVFSVSSFLFKV